MPLDTRMLLTAGPGYVPPLDPAQVVGRGMGLAQAYRQSQMQQMELAEAQRQEQERGTLAQAFRGALTTDPTTGQTRVDMPRAFTAAFRTTSDPLTVFKAQQSYEKQQAETGKSALEARKMQLEQQGKALEFGGQVAQGIEERIAAGANPQEAWEWGMQTMKQAGMPTEGITPFYDATKLAGWKGQAVQIKDKLDIEQRTISNRLREYELAETQKRTRVQEAKERREAAKPAYGFGNELDAAIYAVHGGAIGPGGTPTPAQVADGRRLLQEGKFEIAAGTGSSQIVQTPEGYARVNPRTGAVEMVTGASGTPLQPKPTTEESRAASYATGVRQAHEQATALERKGISTTTGTQLAQKLPFNLGNYLLPAEQQQYQQTILQFAQNLLRKESGAAISQSEYDMTNKTYFPQPGDGPEVIKQKQEARQAVVERIEREGARDTPRRAPAGGARQKPLPTTVEEIDRELADIERQLGGR